MKAWRAISLLLLLIPGYGMAQDAASARPDTSIINSRRAWEQVASARDAAARSRHHDAVALYLEALASDARLVPRVAQEIAYQKLWRDDANKAIFYFRRFLARHPGQNIPEVKRGLAMAYSWSGRQPQAIALYRELVAANGNDGDARMGLGRSLVWNNNLREGFAVLRDVEEEFPPDSATGRGTSSFLLTVLDSYTPHLEARIASSWESDGLDTYRAGADIHFEVLGNKLLQVAPSLALFTMPDRPDVRAPRFQLGLVGPLAYNWNLHAYGWVDHFSSREPLSGATTGNLSWTRPGGDLWLTWIATPRLRVDFGAASQPLLTYQAFERELGYLQGSTSADWRFARHFSMGLSGIYGDYSDGNEKKHGKASLYWRREGKVQVLTGPVLSYMDFTMNYPGGYWSPDWVRNASWRLMLESQTGRSVFKLDGTLGLEREIGAETLTVAGISGHWGLRLGDDLLGAVELGHSRSRFASASGYRRTFLNLILRKIF